MMGSKGLTQRRRGAEENLFAAPRFSLLPGGFA